MKGFCPLCNRALRAYAENPSGFFSFLFLTATKDSDVFQTEKTETEEGLFSLCIYCWEKPGKVLRV